MTSIADWTKPARIWQHYRAPQLPTSPDVERYDAALSNLGPGARVLLLGVTPPLVELCEKRDWNVLALDGNASMIEAVWPGDVLSTAPLVHRREARCGNWTDIPLGERFDAIIGDGVLAFSGSFTSARSSIAYWAQHLNPGGRMVFRSFARPSGAKRDRPDEVVEEIKAGRLDVDAGRWRLAFSLLDDTEELVLDRLHAAYVSTGLRDWMTLNRPLEECAKFESYRGSAILYWFPTIEALGQIGGETMQFQGHLTLSDCSYPLASLCPVSSFIKSD